MKRISLAVLILFALTGEALAQSIDLSGILPPGQGAVSARIIQLLAVLTILSVAPGILVTVTCFTRLVIALSFLRSGLGLPSTPSNIVLISLALFMSFFIMSPTLERVWNDGINPLLENKIDEREAYKRASQPLREFMQSTVREKDLRLFAQLAQNRLPAMTPEEAASDLRVLVPAFMISELRRGFEMGFLILLPFLVIDLIVATLVMSMGMMMLPPTSISLPFKVLFFVLIDGWNLLVGGLVRSFG
ncbi:MAG: flagellar type III secretion system pore protein FliP [Hyphomicrobiaceae bacterium]|uniref:flagellar type III secretion system pore protein FliP n=1 Tax=Pseudorhodoplanes sp. TaxID=1934341 RepID=UPI003D09BB63